MTDPLARAADLQRVPRGDVLGTYDTYQEAQSVVDRLAKADFAVANVSIVGNDLKTVERVTRKLSWNRAALEGAVSGAWFGLFVGLLFSLFEPRTGFNFALLLAAVLIGAAAGLLFRLASYAVARRSRDFDSTRQMLASNYQVLVTDGQLAAAQDALARPVQE
ncbi:general stress protein [Pseudolysinimonas sp.]|uniref:general stress protein n=1 Tax=Pseudolysinimonas sp. TaxID=2680009 RepID=UPI003F82171D